ncbi:MAG: hypothetical protein ACD_2C00180G0008 [uncultured bacterium (gcode 4)]|uniref:Uncharacterized protein n=1 Tax=uncultured bacterium (gcode 4) TaxID=1234023 RepID=K2H0R7_9BACT|nr:MAG: hypothetical protein ACD_2C00180G0008 [uncultured bacterium (gcode 4)]
MIQQELISPETGNEKIIKELTFENLRDRIFKSKDRSELSEISSKWYSRIPERP